MNTITKIVVMGLVCLITTQLNAQKVDSDTISATTSDNKTKSHNQDRIEVLLNLKDVVQKQEKSFLKVEVEAIETRLNNGSISKTEADSLKMAAAQKRAQNIDSRLAIIDKKIDLLKRNDEDYKIDSYEISKVGFSFGEDDQFAGISIKAGNKPKKYDLRTSSDLVFAWGFNNAIIEDQDFDDSPYKTGGSGFVELGWAWKTRVFENSNALRFRYGLSLQWNKLKIKDNQYFVRDGDVTRLEEFPLDLDKAKFRMTNLVVPIHFEFGPSKKIEKDTYFRYDTENQFRIGVGGYAGLNLGTMQKLKYKDDGDRVKDKQKTDFNTSDFVYGLSAYIGVGNTSLYAKYDLNPIFEDQAFDQNNISLGVRFDFD